MSKPIPPISKYMTAAPFTIGKDDTLAKALESMREHHIRHLPVVHGGKLVGLLSDRDLKLLRTLRGVDPNSQTVEDAMTPGVYAVQAPTPLDKVAAEMAEHKYGSAVVLEGEKIAGIFTTVDALVALADTFRS